MYRSYVFSVKYSVLIFKFKILTIIDTNVSTTKNMLKDISITLESSLGLLLLKRKELSNMFSTLIIYATHI